MKRILLSALLISSIWGYGAETKGIPADIDAVVRASYTPAKLSSVRSMKLVYGVSGSGLKGGLLVVRTVQGSKLRVDSVAPEGIFTACRNGDDFWGFDGKHGAVMLEKKDIRAMKYDLAFLPIPFDRPEIFAPLTYTGKVNVDTDGFTTVAADAPMPKLVVQVNRKSGLIDRVETEDSDGISVVSFRDYKDFDGATLATRIVCSSPEGAVTLRLRSVDWNTEFPAALFVRSDSRKDSELVLLQQGISAVVAAHAPAPKKVLTQEEKQAKEKAHAEKMAAQRKQRIAGCHKKLRDIDTQIKEKEEARKKCEAYFIQNRSDAVNVAQQASEKTYVYRSSWSYHGWGSVRPRRVSSGSSTQRKLAKALAEEADEARREYLKLGKELSNLRAKRSEVQYELEKLEKLEAK